MSDSYLKFSNTKFGAKLTSMLGLPQPQALVRYADLHAQDSKADKPIVVGSASGGDERVVATLLSIYENADQSICRFAAAESPDKVSGEPSDKSGLKAFGKGQTCQVLFFDATALQLSTSNELYEFFNSLVKSLVPHGRIIIVARPPELCEVPKHAIAQRALEGFMRSIAKELRKAITAQLVYVEEGAEPKAESTLRFLLSEKSAYVSGQVVRVGRGLDIDAKTKDTAAAAIDWQLPFNVNGSPKKVLVTGASQGIGLAIATLMARDGAQVICLDIPRAQQALDKVANSLNGSVIALDLSSEQAAQILVEHALADGGWDVVIHNAGITMDKTIAKMSANAWSKVVDVNLQSQQKINEALVAKGGIKPNGRIVCVSSISGIAGNRGQTNYAYTKAGVIGMVDAYAPIFAKQGITINAVAPGFIETEMTSKMPFGIREAGRRLNSLSQGGLPVDVAETIAWLASPASSGLTGNTIRVCGQSLLGA